MKNLIKFILNIFRGNDITLTKKQFMTKAQNIIHNKRAGDCIYFCWSLDIRTSCGKRDDKYKYCNLLCDKNCLSFKKGI